MNEAQRRSNIALAAEADRIARQPNGDPGGEDAFDGVPADTITGQIVQPQKDEAVYAVLTVWPHSGESDVFSWGNGSRGDNEKRVAECNGTGRAGRSYLVRIAVPEIVK